MSQNLQHTHTFIFSNCLAYYEIYLHHQDISPLITTFVKLCSNNVCQLNNFYFSHLNIYTIFYYFYLFYIFFSRMFNIVNLSVQ